MKEIKELEKFIVSHGYPVFFKKIKGKEMYVCSTFPFRIKQDVIDYIGCHFNIVEREYFDVTFTYKTEY